MAVLHRRNNLELNMDESGPDHHRSSALIFNDDPKHVPMNDDKARLTAPTSS